MLKQFCCPDGTIYAKCGKQGKMAVDEVISFLEQHRGKVFWNCAAENTSFRADEEVVSCDSFEFWMEELAEKDDDLVDHIYDFFEEN